jgi:membrane protease YdiL (CAAX protease family)
MSTHLPNSAKAFLFFGIAFGLTLTASLLYPLLGAITPLIHTYTPTLSVLIMMLVVTRDGYSKTGWVTLGLHRLGLRYWVLALVGPLALMCALYGLAWSSGVGQFVLPEGFTLPLLASNLSTGLGIAFALGLGEEIGFRGYALSRLMHLGPTRALLLCGLMFAIWHFPLMLLTPVYPVLGNWLIIGPILILTLTFAGVFYGYLRLSSESVWPSTLAHGVINTSFEWLALFTATASPLALELLVGEKGLLTLAATGLTAGFILYRLRQRPGTLAEQLPAGVSVGEVSGDVPRSRVRPRDNMMA